MNDSRAAAIFPDDLETLEAAGELLFRYHENTAGIRLLAIALRLRGQTGIRQAGVFACDIDESAGMAELSNIRVVPRPPEDVEPPPMGGMPAPVTELHGYSRKAPCS